RDAPAVIAYRNAVVGVDGDDDVIAMACQRFVDGVVDHFENHVMQAGAVRGVADVHARALAHGLEAFEHLDGFGAVLRHDRSLDLIRHSFPGQIRIGMTTYLNSSSSGVVRRADALTSGCTDQRTDSVFTLASTSRR